MSPCGSRTPGSAPRSPNGSPMRRRPRSSARPRSARRSRRSSFAAASRSTVVAEAPSPAPTRTSPTQPTSEYGRMVADVESTAHRVGERIGVAVSALRLAPVLGPHVPSPLGRAAAPARGSVQPARRFAVRGDPRFRRGPGVRRRSPATPPGTAQRRSTGSDHDDASDPARSAPAACRWSGRNGESFGSSASSSALRCRSTSWS